MSCRPGTRRFSEVGTVTALQSPVLTALLATMLMDLA
jgi:hypothetical protein